MHAPDASTASPSDATAYALEAEFLLSRIKYSRYSVGCFKNCLFFWLVVCDWLFIVGRTHGYFN
jgi:hypothetical protein